MDTLQVKSNQITKMQRDIDKQINKMLAEATLLLYEIEAIIRKESKHNG